MKRNRLVTRIALGALMLTGAAVLVPGGAWAAESKAQPATHCAAGAGCLSKSSATTPTMKDNDKKTTDSRHKPHTMPPARPAPHK